MTTADTSFSRGAAWGQDETVDQLKELILRIERGELACAAIRIFNPDGTWEDVLIGGQSDAERAKALESLKAADRTAN